MALNNTAQISHQMSTQTIADFLQYESDNGASGNMMRRYKGTVKVLYAFLSDDKLLTRERLLEWRRSMENSGYASVTILNYVKCINRYLDHVGCSEIRFNKGRANDIRNMSFGFLTAIEPTGERNRGDVVWHCACKCGNTIELPAARLLSNNTLSCGCLKGAHFKRTNKYYEGTSLTQSITEKVESTHSVSGYVGVTPKRGKWQAYIRYKGVHYSLGCYWDIQDAVKARARAKEIVVADAQGLLDLYAELEKSFPHLPNRRTAPKKAVPGAEWTVNNTPGSSARRCDNTSGYVGVCYRNGRWEARICYQGRRYMLGRFTNEEAAILARKKAERDLKEDPLSFAEEYAQKYAYYINKENKSEKKGKNKK